MQKASLYLSTFFMLFKRFYELTNFLFHVEKTAKTALLDIPSLTASASLMQETDSPLYPYNQIRAGSQAIFLHDLSFRRLYLDKYKK